MKKIVLLSAALLLAVVCNAQWKVNVEDDGFDDRHYVASVMSKDSEAKVDMVQLDRGICLAIETPEITYIKNYCKVEIIFKIKGENKSHEINGCASSGTSTLLLTVKNGSTDNMGEIFSDEFLTDFKNASLMKVKITYAVPYRGTTYDTYEEYVFNMTGSTNAYNRVKNQK